MVVILFGPPWGDMTPYTVWCLLSTGSQTEFRGGNPFGSTAALYKHTILLYVFKYGDVCKHTSYEHFLMVL